MLHHNFDLLPSCWRRPQVIVVIVKADAAHVPTMAAWQSGCGLRRGGRTGRGMTEGGLVPVCRLNRPISAHFQGVRSSLCFRLRSRQTLAGSAPGRDPMSCDSLYPTFRPAAQDRKRLRLRPQPVILGKYSACECDSIIGPRTPLHDAGARRSS